MRWVTALVLALSLGCPPPAQFREVRPGLSCDRATRVTHRTLVELGYTITELVPARYDRAGVVSGTKPTGDGGTTTGRVVITCTPQGATLQPIEDSTFSNYDFSRVFGYSFKVLVHRPDEEKPEAARGLEVLVDTLTNAEAVLDLGGVPTAGGAVPVRVTVRNHTEREIALDPADIQLVGGEGTRATALTGPALAAALAPGAASERVRAELLRSGRVAANSTVIGFLVYPAGTYREAYITVEDVETQETEGFVTPVE
jgi:hypothetical protein